MLHICYDTYFSTYYFLETKFLPRKSVNFLTKSSNGCNKEIQDFFEVNIKRCLRDKKFEKTWLDMVNKNNFEIETLMKNINPCANHLMEHMKNGRKSDFALPKRAYLGAFKFIWIMMAKNEQLKKMKDHEDHKNDQIDYVRSFLYHGKDKKEIILPTSCSSDKELILPDNENDLKIKSLDHQRKVLEATEKCLRVNYFNPSGSTYLNKWVYTKCTRKTNSNRTQWWDCKVKS
jgi:hypothetical protein